MISSILTRSRHILAIGAAIGGLAIAPAWAQTDVTLALDWIVGGTHAPYFVAKDQGFYKDAGLNVTISRGFGSGDTVKRVASGTSDFGIADTSTIIAAMANEKIPVKIVGMIYDKATLGIIYLEESGIKKPKDLEGRSLGRSASGASVNMLPAFLNANGVDRSKIKEVVVDAGTYMPILMAGRVDAVLEQSIHLSKFQKVASEQGKKAAAMRYADYGMPAYGNAIIVSNDTAQKKGDLIKSFVEATLKGYAWALDHPDEAVGIMMKNNPELDREATRGELAALSDIQSSEDVKQHGLSYIDPKKLQATRDNVTEVLLLPRVVPMEEIYTADFLPSEPVHVQMSQ